MLIFKLKLIYFELNTVFKKQFEICSSNEVVL